MQYARLCCPALIRRETYIFTPVIHVIFHGYIPRLPYKFFSLLEYLDNMVLIGINAQVAGDDQRLLDDFHRRHTGVIQ